VNKALFGLGQEEDMKGNGVQYIMAHWNNFVDKCVNDGVHPEFTYKNVSLLKDAFKILKRTGNRQATMLQTGKQMKGSRQKRQAEDRSDPGFAESFQPPTTAATTRGARPAPALSAEQEESDTETGFVADNEDEQEEQALAQPPAAQLPAASESPARIRSPPRKKTRGPRKKPRCRNCGYSLETLPNYDEMHPYPDGLSFATKNSLTRLCMVQVPLKGYPRMGKVRHPPR
jgi:hypothetical protein